MLAAFQATLFRVGLATERRRSGLVPKDVQTGGHTYHYLERTGPGDVIVLLHGFAAEKDNWLAFVGHLPADARVLAIDLPGHGDNARPMDERFNAQTLASGVLAVLDALAIHAFHVAGNSLGGSVAILIASERPEAVSSLGLFNSAGVFPHEQSEFFELLEAGDNALVVHNRAELERFFRLIFHAPPPMPWPMRAVLARRYAERAEFHEKMWEDVYSREDASQHLRRVRAPALILWGDRDRVLHVASVPLFARDLADSETVILNETGHCPMLERPGRCADAYSRFLQRVRER